MQQYILTRFFLICVFVLMLQPARSQNPVSELTKIIKPSPEAAAMTRYALYPMNYSSGTPQISVPIYTVQARDFQLPIQLDYNAAGVKVNDLASFVGLSWNLSGIGTITRVIMGRPDEDPANGVLAVGIRRDAQIDYQYCYDATRSDAPKKDTQPDIFYYSFAGYNGKFYFGTNTTNIVSVPHASLKIVFENGLFKIIDTKGITYEFTKTAISLSKAGDSPYDGAVTSWHLTKITLVNGKDEINFSYEEYSTGVMRDYNYSSIVGKVPTMNCSPDASGTSCIVTYVPTTEGGVSFTENLYSNIYVKFITFPEGQIEFKTVGNRMDYGTRILDEIVVTDLNGSTIKKFQLKHSYFEASTGGYNPYATNQDKYRLRLDGLYEMAGGETLKHRFEYNSQALPPRNNCGTDHWGYYNGYSSNRTLMSNLDDRSDNNIYYAADDRNYPLDNSGQSLGNRLPSETYMKACMLTRIYYPTGGYTDFNFEPNQFQRYKVVPYGASVMAIAKLSDGPNDPYRVARITPPTNLMTLTLSIPLYHDINKPFATFQDITAGTATVRYTTFPGESTQRTTIVNVTPGHTYEITASVSPNPNNPEEDPDYITVSIMAQWSNGNTTVPEIKSEAGLRVKSISSFDINNVLLEKQSFTYGENQNSLGKLSFFPYLFDKRSYEQEYVYGFSPDGACGYYQTKRLHVFSEPLFTPSDIGGSKIFYTTVTKYTESASGEVNGKTEYSFDFELDDRLDNTVYPDPALLISMNWKCGMPVSEKYFRSLDGRKNGQFKAIKEIKNDYTLFDKPGYYGLKINQKIMTVGCAVQSYNSGTTRNYAAFEYPITSGIKKIIKTTNTDFKEDGLTAAMVVVTDYHYENATHLQPTQIDVTDSQGKMIKTINRYPQDKSSIADLEASASEGIDALVRQNRIEEVIEKEVYRGTSFVSRARTNFKAWTALVTAPINFQLQEGTGLLENRVEINSYDSQGNILQQSKPNDMVTSYIWSYKGTQVVAEIKNSTYQNIINVLGQSTLNALQESAGTDEQALRQTLQPLRNSPAMMQAHITTLTYKPLVGISSITDPNGRKKSFEYDLFNRLSSIKDNNGDVIKAYQYYYIE